ncbi:ring finger domain-containing protein [Hirsutella rhossiliensis]|uniref:RING-type E3 ubiquitin transferase n=1 Tax=Hirsutella rhossiliensis TaxID=111463 RepID=A0A9P8N0S5_9HYPO|nr:ring finger domain-containing protein [Hirsutella rhossiliensis]KAH0964507.1 ring finger domain-containing protein [Hirsutella rhossiliensis]
MASRSHPGGHLDATAGREVVYCHACSNEWHRDEYGLSCPACDGDITEIVNPYNDPRELDQFASMPSSPASRAARYDDDSDPEEADIEEFAGPHGFIHRRNVRNGSNHADHHDPGVEPVLHRFYEMVQNLSPERNMNAREHPGHDDNPPAWPHIQRTTFTSGGPFGGGTASVTIFSGPPPGAHGMGRSHDGSPADQFQAIFSNVLRDFGPPRGEHQGPPPNLARGLQDILSLFSGVNAPAGDAVDSQEAFDRIVTQLMEANPQSNAAPPASEEALKTLDRKTVDQDMLKGESKTECTICIDEMHIGDEAVTLPCKHWFHEECVTLWLKEHNTCPICRTPVVESGNGNNQSSNNGGSDGASNTETDIDFADEPARDGVGRIRG